MPGALSPQDNSELLAVLGGLAEERSALDKRALDKTKLAILRLVFRSSLLIAIGSRKQPLLLPSLLPRLQGPGRVAVVFTDEEAARSWMDARNPDGPACHGFAEITRFLGDRQPDPRRWRRHLQRASVNQLAVNPAGPLTFTATTLDFDQASSRLVGRGAAAPDPDPQRAWLDPSARAEARAQARRLLDQLRRSGPGEAPELEQEIEAINRFGSRLLQSQLLLLPGRGNANTKLHAVLGAASAGDPCLAADGLLEVGEMTLSALAGPEIDERQTKRLTKQAKWIATMLDGLAELGYRTGDIKQFSPALKRAGR